MALALGCWALSAPPPSALPAAASPAGVTFAVAPGSAAAQRPHPGQPQTSAGTVGAPSSASRAWEAAAHAQWEQAAIAGVRLFAASAAALVVAVAALPMQPAQARGGFLSLARGAGKLTKVVSSASRLMVVLETKQKPCAAECGSAAGSAARQQ